ncbi:MAG: aminopeptidase P N-terminal domain-containing protein [Bacteroidia bacterium]
MSLALYSQSDKFRYDSDLLSKEFHAGRRNALRALMPDSSVAVFFANPERNRSNDVDYQYSQDPDFYYLSGYPEPNALLFIFKEKVQIDSVYTNELLFVQERNPYRESWNGRRLGIEGVRKELGFAHALLNSQFADLSMGFPRFHKIYCIEPKDDIRDDKNDKGDLFSLVKHFRNKTNSLNTKDNYALVQFMAGLREVKTPEEMKLLRKAVRISCESHAVLMHSLDTSMTEYQAQAVIEYGFKARGSEYPGYPSIVGAGENSCILHYIENRRHFKTNDILVLDAGAEYHGYTADITRSLPVNGHFSPEQRLIYDIVYDAQAAGINACMEGNEFRAAHKAAFNVISRRMKDLGIIKNELEAMKYFFHGTSHYLGLDVHDAGLYGKLKPGNVITVEPGIYIPEGSDCDKKWWNIGIRIEDDILITSGKPENLSASLPSKAEEIERIMREKQVFPFKPAEK